MARKLAGVTRLDIASSLKRGANFGKAWSWMDRSPETVVGPDARDFDVFEYCSQRSPYRQSNVSLSPLLLIPALQDDAPGASRASLTPWLAGHLGRALTFIPNAGWHRLQHRQRQRRLERFPVASAV